MVSGGHDRLLSLEKASVRLWCVCERVSKLGLALELQGMLVQSAYFWAHPYTSESTPKSRFLTVSLGEAACPACETPVLWKGPRASLPLQESPGFCRSHIHWF